MISRASGSSVVMSVIMVVCVELPGPSNGCAQKCLLNSNVERVKLYAVSYTVAKRNFNNYG